MTHHQSDEFDELLRAAARDYHRPDETPRDLMWQHIRTRRVERVPRDAWRANRRAWFVPAIAAAVLVLGIAIGRVYERRTAAPPAAVAVRTNDSAKPVAVAPTLPDSLVNTIDTAQVPSRSAPNPRSAPPAAPRATPDAPRAMPSLAYRLAVVQHLASTEAMLTSFRSAARNGDVDAQITKWARDLLTTTRLLQASAAQQDPTMKHLLDDLELVLVQIAQYTSAGAHHAEELELIEHSIERRGVIGKLHTNIPARLGPAGT